MNDFEHYRLVSALCEAGFAPVSELVRLSSVLTGASPPRLMSASNLAGVSVLGLGQPIGD